jgi:HAD superfamily hydrolase (TIGR01490 family)
VAESVKLAIFDFDGTLATGHLWIGLTRHHKAKKVKRMAVYAYLFSHFPIWIAAKLKLYDDNKNKIKWGEDLSTLFKGFTREQSDGIFEWVMENYFGPAMRPDILEILGDHKKKGDTTIIVSGMFKGFLEEVGRRLGVAHIVGTELEMSGGIYTGKIIPPLCYGKNKLFLLNKYLKENRIEADLSQSYAYSDSISDLSILQAVGYPVPTYPDKKLVKLANMNRWPIIGNTTTTTNNL